MRALLVGAGGMGRAWARNLHGHPDVQVAAWIDVRPSAAQLASEEEQIPVEFAGVDLAEAASRVGADFVVDVTIPEAHHDVTLQALRLGLPVLGEKPMAATMEQARAMVAASEAAGKLYMVSQSRRYNRQLAGFRSLIYQHCGGVGILNADFYIGAHFGGFRDEMPSPLVLDMAIHTFDEARYLTGADPVAVYAEEFNPSWSWYKGDASANALFEMTDGIRFTYSGSWCAEGKATSWDADWRAVGPKGTATWVNNQTASADIVASDNGFVRDTTTVEAINLEFDEQIRGSLNEFLDALSTGKVPQGECHDNIKSLAMVFATIESSRQRARIHLSEIL